MRRGLKDDFLAYVKRSPHANAREIAAALDCHEAYVRSTARRQGIRLASNGRRGRPVTVAPKFSRPRLRIKEFRGTPEQYDALARKVALVDLEYRDCRWPVGDPRDPDFGFCGHIKEPGKPYCAHHQKRSEGVGTPAERSAHRVRP